MSVQYPCMKRRRGEIDTIAVSILRDEALRRAEYRDLHPPCVLFTGGSIAKKKVAFKFELPVAARLFTDGLRAVAAEHGVSPQSLLKEST